MKSESVPSAGLCGFPWCVTHEVVDYGTGVSDQIHFGAHQASSDVRGGVLVAVTNNDHDSRPGVMIAAPDIDRGLWYSATELREFAGLLMAAADALEEAQEA